MKILRQYPLAKNVSRFANKLQEGLRTRRGRDVVLYLLCLCVAASFWLMISLDEEIERDYELEVVVQNVPDSVVLVSDVPSTINVLLKGKGTQFFRYHFKKLPRFNIDFRQYTDKDKMIYMSRGKMDSRIRDMFGQNVSVLAVTPDSLKVLFTSISDGRKLPIHINVTATASPQSVLSGKITSNIDSVTVYSSSPLPKSIKYVTTDAISLNEVRDTLVKVVPIKAIPGVKIYPPEIEVTIPAELLMSKKEKLPIGSKNMPERQAVSVFPQFVEISYLVPMSKYNNEVGIEAFVDYKEFHNSPSTRAKVNISPLPQSYRLVSVSQDSVGYVVEHR